MCLFSFSAYYKNLPETFPKGSATQSGPFLRKVGTAPVWNPPSLASLNFEDFVLVGFKVFLRKLELKRPKPAIKLARPALQRPNRHLIQVESDKIMETFLADGLGEVCLEHAKTQDRYATLQNVSPPRGRINFNVAVQRNPEISVSNATTSSFEDATCLHLIQHVIFLSSGISGSQDLLLFQLRALRVQRRPQHKSFFSLQHRWLHFHSRCSPPLGLARVHLHSCYP